MTVMKDPHKLSTHKHQCMTFFIVDFRGIIMYDYMINIFLCISVLYFDFFYNYPLHSLRKIDTKFALFTNNLSQL